MSVLEDRALADDAVQETFVRAWRAAFRYDPARPLGPWLAAIARRSAIDIYRREMRPTRGGHAPEADVASGEDPFDGTWMRWEVRRALDRLPERDRSLMRLLHLEGHTHAQAARLLDVPVGTVKSRSHRAHRRLAEMLAHLAPVP
jgi:RNA polymerase sigma-70 factor (ECF subfamily)